MTTLVLLLTIGAVSTALIVWFGGLIGSSSVSSMGEAETRLQQVITGVVAARGDSRSAVSLKVPDSGTAGQPEGDLLCGRQGSSVQTPPVPNTLRDPSFLDAAVPGGLAFASGALDWLTPDRAAMDALAQATHEQISGALDLHKTLAEEHYHLLSEHSLANWRGHIGEAQITEQIDSWAGAGTVEMPDASNFAGADLSFFGGDYQVKFYSDFRDIDNVHGDTLIVNEDAANLPADALHVDFSEAFDPSMLDGHDVIVAEGLTLAGADDAWEAAAGLWAGGLDGGDALDGAGDAFIPGIGSAIRIATSGYKRRSALADSDLRGRAMGRVARDAGYGLAGGGGGAMVGGILGGLIDVATMGATLGAGATVGSMVGAAYGGKKASGAARAADAKKVETARSRVADALADYGQSVEETQRDAEVRWTKAVMKVDARAEQLTAVRTAQAIQIQTLAGRDLETLTKLSASEAKELLDQCAQAVDAVATTERSPRARKRQADWRQQAAETRTKIHTNAQPDLHEILVLMTASPDGSAAVERWLLGRLDRRAVILATQDRLITVLERQTLADRAALSEDLGRVRVKIQKRVKKRLAAPIERVGKQTTRLKDELVVGGYLSKEDAARLGSAPKA